MKVSIILPTYNSEATLKRSIESALDQDYDDYEIIVINDGSEDNTKDILKEFEGKIKVIDQENQGALRASNNGFKQALGEYVIKLDSDDKFESTILSKMAKVLDEREDIDFVYCDYHEKKGDKVTLVKTKDNVYNTIGIGIMFRKDKFKEQGFFNEKSMFAEYDLLLKVDWTGYCIEEPLFWYLRRDESITGSKKWVLDAIEELKRLYPDRTEDINKIRGY